MDATLIALADALANAADVRKDQAKRALGTSQHSDFNVAALVLDSIADAFGSVVKERAESWP